MSERGIGDRTHVIAVDHLGGQFATRLWWALRYYGHDRVSVLDGGWKRWVEELRPVESGAVSPPPAEFHARPRPGLRATATEVLARLSQDDLQLIDARDAGQYSGARRRGPRGGHIPGALNLPRELFFAEEGGFRPVDEIRSRITASDLRPDRPTIAYCNGGVAATVVLFNLFRLGFSSPDQLRWLLERVGSPTGPARRGWRGTVGEWQVGAGAHRTTRWTAQREECCGRTTLIPTASRSPYPMLPPCCFLDSKPE
jgi:3-mercaptopyruvate sulfurtransferase SseA